MINDIHGVTATCKNEAWVQGTGFGVDVDPIHRYANPGHGYLYIPDE